MPQFPSIVQKPLNICCFSSLAPAFASINDYAATNAISMRIEESLKSAVVNPIDFVNDILTNQKRNKDKSIQRDNEPIY